MSPGSHTEHAFETAIEAHLVAHGWMKAAPQTFDPARAISPTEVTSFLMATQPEVWLALKKQHGDGLYDAVLDTLTKALDSFGTLHVLRHGIKFFGKLLKLAYFRPAHGMNPEVLAKYEQNRLTLTRQVRPDPEGKDSVDMLLSVNGLPVATVELKNPLTGQNVNHAIHQYKKDREPTWPLFGFKKRALVHFAVDPDHAFMTTRLAKSGTVFLPFNRGRDGGAGNPPHPSGHRTAYLWEEVWERHSFLDILGRFMHVATEEKQVGGKLVRKETVIFPRYHQLEAVRRLEAAAKAEGPGQSYLVQHSAGSGKSNSIAWLAYRLSELHKNDEKVFHSVIVVTDRRVLDKQLQDTIYQFEHKQGVVDRIDEHSSQLADALAKGTPIIITTLQKFPFVTDKIGQLPERAYAVIVDEAHSSQGGEAATKMKEVLRAHDSAAWLHEREASASDEEEDDAEDKLRQVMESRGRQKNLSFFAFTATPKGKTLAFFGRPGPDGKPLPFHLYSMRQAIEEGFILDVLQSYTTYKAYWRLLKKTAEDPKVPKREAAAQLGRFMLLHPHNIAQKVEVIVEHFRRNVRHKIGGRAKAMVVTSSRLHAVRYRQAFDKYLEEKGYTDIQALVAFSGQVEDPDVPGSSYTEEGMNGGIREKELPERFASDAYRVLLVANKYQTGFDQPLLHTMYVDKRLSGVQAVQTLSRLNRTAPGKEDTFVLDFVNEAEEIRRSFQPYYEQTTLSETADHQQLYELAHQLEGAQVFWKSEVEAFAKVFYAPKAKQSVTDHAAMYRHLDPAVDRFEALDEEAQDAFRKALSSYVRLYAFLSQIIPFTDPDLERLYTFARFLETKLPHDPKKAPIRLDGDVALGYYRLDKIREGTIELNQGEVGQVKGPTEVGTGKATQDEAPLSEIIGILNERFGLNLSESDRLVFDAVVEDSVADAEVVQQARANPLENFALPMKEKLDGIFVDRMERNQELVTRFFSDDAFKAVLADLLVRRIYEEARR